MGKRGPTPRPTALKVLHGERRDRINTREPVPTAAPVDPPEWLSAEAVAVWHRLAPDLTTKGILTAWDADAFAVLCDAIVHYRHASTLVAQAGVLIRGRKDAAVKNPAMQLVRDTAATIRAYAQEFGLTPAARAALDLPDEPDATGPNRLLS